MLAKKIYNFIVFGVARLRAAFWRPFCGKMGKDVNIMRDCRILCPRGVEIGSHVIINHGTDIGGHGSVKIGDYVMFGPNCNVLSANHDYLGRDKPMMQQEIKAGYITIEDDVWVGANAVILPDITIGRGSIIGANAVVTKDVEPYSIVGGVPARLIKHRFEDARNI